MKAVDVANTILSIKKSGQNCTLSVTHFFLRFLNKGKKKRVENATKLITPITAILLTYEKEPKKNLPLRMSVFTF
jgi:hypothetical protein